MQKMKPVQNSWQLTSETAQTRSHMPLLNNFHRFWSELVSEVAVLEFQSLHGPLSMIFVAFGFQKDACLGLLEIADGSRFDLNQHFSYTTTKVCIPINPLNPYRVLILRKRIRIIRGVYKNINTKHTLTYTQTKTRTQKPQWASKNWVWHVWTLQVASTTSKSSLQKSQKLNMWKTVDLMHSVASLFHAFALNDPGLSFK